MTMDPKVRRSIQLKLIARFTPHSNGVLIDCPGLTSPEIEHYSLDE